MRLWRRASGALKDNSSILVATWSRQTAIRNSDIEAAVIRATSHDDARVDYRNAQRVFSWIRMSPAHLRPFAWALCMRMEKTRSWAVALKGLMLMHGVFCCKVPAVQKIGRLPFDLSNFKDGHASPAKMWGYNAFIRAYYAFLDQKAAFICLDLQERKVQAQNNRLIIHAQKPKTKQQDCNPHSVFGFCARSHGNEEPIEGETPMLQELVRLQKTQGLLDMLLQIKPQAEGMIRVLILEAMDCVIIEICDIYSRICNGITKVVEKIYSACNVEASMALKVLQKATAQGEDLSLYFEYCRELGMVSASECPKVEQVPEEDIRALERIINGEPEITGGEWSVPEEEKAIIVRETRAVGEQNGSKSTLQTVITSKWEVFDEDLMKVNEEEDCETGKQDPFVGPLIPLVHQPFHKQQDLPDLISLI